MTTPTRKCPKCGCLLGVTWELAAARGAEQPSEPAGECPACGVVFSKIQASEPSNRPAPVPSGAYRVQARRAAQPLLLGVLAFLMLLSVGALATVAWRDGEEPLVSAAEIAPPEFAAAGTPGALDGAAASEPAKPADPGPRSSDAAKRRLATLAPFGSPDPNTASGLTSARATAPSAAAASRASTARSADAAEGKSRWVDPDSRWFEGAAGFDQGLVRARDKNQAVLVYFYADWCGYCRQLESELLNRAVVEEYTKYLVKIKVNPEAGSSERNLAKTYGVTGYPSVFVHPAGLGQPKKIRGMTKKSGSWRPLSTEAYVENLATAAGERFGAS